MIFADPRLAREFSPAVTFLNSATYGLEPASARALMATYDDQRSAGTLEPGDVDGIIDSCRQLIGQLFGRTADDVAISASAAQFIGTVAHSLAPGSRVLLAEDDFTQLTDLVQGVHQRVPQAAWAEYSLFKLT